MGMSPESANKVLVNAGFYMRANGAVDKRSGSLGATKQQYPAGSKLKRGSVIQVEFYDVNGVSEGISGGR